VRPFLAHPRRAAAIAVFVLGLLLVSVAAATPHRAAHGRRAHAAHGSGARKCRGHRGVACKRRAAHGSRPTANGTAEPTSVAPGVPAPHPNAETAPAAESGSKQPAGGETTIPTVPPAEATKPTGSGPPAVTGDPTGSGPPSETTDPGGSGPPAETIDQAEPETPAETVDPLEPEGSPPTEGSPPAEGSPPSEGSPAPEGSPSPEGSPAPGGSPPHEATPPLEVPPLPTQSSAGPQLRWAPPELVNPITIQLGNGYTHTSLSPQRDYIVKLPPTDKLGGTWLDGGHNVVVIGGEITVPSGTRPGSAYDAERNGIYIKDATGTVHIEGVRINGAPEVEFDGVDINAPQATVQLENMRIEGVRGRFSAFHGDVVQPWGGVADLRIDRMTASSNYQGLTLQQDLGPIGSAELSDVDLTGNTEGPLDKGGHLLWLTRGSGTCEAFPVSLSNVFVDPRPDLTFATSVWPAVNSRLPCDETGISSAIWPTLPVAGSVTDGTPPTGPFVAPGVAGLGYVSPGYAP
jgi:hypothetical protein